MSYQDYRSAIFKIWEIIKQEDFSYSIEIENDQEYVKCGLCNPAFGIGGSLQGQICPFDKRSEKDVDDRPCMDSCQIFLKSDPNGNMLKGIPAHKLKITMSKFMNKFITKEAIDSLKSLAKACRSQKGVSVTAADEHIKVAEKVIESTNRFGGFEFKINDGKLTATRKQ